MEFVLKGIFDYAVSNGWIGENPVDRVTVPKIASDDDDMVFLSVREVELLADEAEKIGTKRSRRKSPPGNGRSEISYCGIE